MPNSFQPTSSHLARTTAERLDTTSGFEISLLISNGGGLPIFIRSFEKGVDHLHDRDPLTGIHKFQPVTGILAANSRPEEVLDTVRGLVLDIMNQGGSVDLGKRYLKAELSSGRPLRPPGRKIDTPKVSRSWIFLK